MKNAWKFLAVAFLFFSCKSSDLDEIGFLKSNWKIDDGKAKKAMVGDNVEIEAETVGLEDGSSAIITILWESLGKSGELDKIDTEVVDGKIKATWKITDADDFYSSDNYVVPKYFFVVESSGVTSEKSAALDVYGFIKRREIDENGNPIPNKKITIYKTDGSEITAETDENGSIYLPWLELGKYSTRRAIEIKEN